MRPPRGPVGDALVAGLAGAALSGVPSTAWTLWRGEDVLEAGRATGSIVLGARVRGPLLLAAAVPVHLGLSLGWAAVLARLVPRGRELPGGVAGGLLIAALDLAVVAPRLAPRVRALPQGRQWADHVAYGLVVGAALRWLRTQPHRDRLNLRPH